MLESQALKYYKSNNPDIASYVVNRGDHIDTIDNTIASVEFVESLMDYKTDEITWDGDTCYGILLHNQQTSKLFTIIRA